MLETDVVQYAPASFYRKMKEIHILMRNYDSIIPNMDNAKIEPSLPFQWFFRGETMLLWNERIGIQTAATLNPFISWLGCGVIAVYLVFSVLNSLLSKRGIQWTAFSRSTGSSEWRGNSQVIKRFLRT
jgi:dolichyl-phosphate-mannose--protein O-mannosyl transferase